MSIMPGIENFAPERTETSSGACGSPNLRPTVRSTSAIAVRSCASIPAGIVLPPA